jgi:hypothetical protein
MSIITYALPGKLPLHANTTQIADVKVQEDCFSNSKYYIYYIPGPTCRGSVPLYAPPLSYKRGGVQRYKGDRPNLDLDSQLSSFHNNPTHSGVGCYAPAARTTLNPRVFLSSSFIYQQAKRLSPLLILGFRAGALRHTAGEFALRHIPCWIVRIITYILASYVEMASPNKALGSRSDING